MKAIRLARIGATAGDVAGRVLARDLRDAAGRIAVGKGTRLSDDTWGRLESLPWSELHLVEPALDDVHEADAGPRLARAAAGGGVTVGTLGGGHWTLEAMHRGLLAVDRVALDDVNTLEGLCVYTLFDGQVVDAGEPVARAKIVPFVIDGDRLSCGETIARRAGGIVHVRPFRRVRVGAIAQESLGPRAMARFRESLGEKIEWFGSQLLEPRFVAPERGEVERGIRALLAEKPDIIVLAGSKPMDPLDAAFEALGQLGGRMIRHGVPAHPGSLCWLATVSEVPVIGMPSCGLFSQATVFDLVLPRLLTGERLDGNALARMGHGGFLTSDMAFRFPPYRAARARGAVE